MLRHMVKVNRRACCRIVAMKKFFLVLLFCVFPFQVLAGDVSYWADGQIKSIDGQDVSYWSDGQMKSIGKEFPER